MAYPFTSLLRTYAPSIAASADTVMERPLNPLAEAVADEAAIRRGGLPVVI